MGFYDKYILPRFLDFACSMSSISKQREKVVPLAQGRVLEIGMGSGLNLPYYDYSKVEKLWGLEPEEAMRKRAEPKLKDMPCEFEFLGLKGEDIPLEDKSVDTVLSTFTMCTIPEVMVALDQMKRVLKPGGVMVFSEHGKAPDAAVEKWQSRINPTWNKLAGGCNLNREIDRLVTDAGFDFVELNHDYVPGPKIASYMYWGVAKAR